MSVEFLMQQANAYYATCTTYTASQVTAITDIVAKLNFLQSSSSPINMAYTFVANQYENIFDGLKHILNLNKQIAAFPVNSTGCEALDNLENQYKIANVTLNNVSNHNNTNFTDVLTYAESDLSEVNLKFNVTPADYSDLMSSLRNINDTAYSDYNNFTNSIISQSNLPNITEVEGKCAELEVIEGYFNDNKTALTNFGLNATGDFNTTNVIADAANVVVHLSGIYNFDNQSYNETHLQSECKNTNTCSVDEHQVNIFFNGTNYTCCVDFLQIDLSSI